MASATPAQSHPKEHALEQPPAPTGRYIRTAQRYQPPAVTVIDQDGHAVPLAEAFSPEADLVVNFIFTTCTTICPTLSATLQGLRGKLGDEAAGLHMASISIDPENDRPAALKAYAKRYHATSAWRFYTGSAEDIRSVLRAFDSYGGDKANHQPITLLRRAHSQEWIRVEGFATAEELAHEWRALVRR
jgi:protein SCO1/2